MASLRPAARAVARARPSLSSLLRLAPKRFESSQPPPRDLEVGELQGATFKIEPLRRVGEDPATMRARLLCASHPVPSHPATNPPLSLRGRRETKKGREREMTDKQRAGTTDQSRKRGTLESDLLLSTFAARRLATMTPAQLAEYDRFLDENDWDIYYWATQDAVEPGGGVSTNPSSPSTANATAQQQQNGVDPAAQQSPRPGEWAQTVGTFKAAYRPVPARWAGSEVLALLREHVESRRGSGRGGMGFMPALEEYKM